MRQERRSKNKKHIAIVGVLIALVFLFGFTAFGGFLNKIGFKITGPFVFLKNKTGDLIKPVLISFKTKKDLTNERDFLFQENLLLKTKTTKMNLYLWESSRG